MQDSDGLWLTDSLGYNDVLSTALSSKKCSHIVHSLLTHLHPFAIRSASSFFPQRKRDINKLNHAHSSRLIFPSLGFQTMHILDNQHHNQTSPFAFIVVAP